MIRKVLLLLLGLALLVSCTTAQRPSPSPELTRTIAITTATPSPETITGTPAISVTPSSVTLTPTQLKYVLLDQFTPLFFCDPDYYPVGNPEGEKKNAFVRFPKIRSDAELYQAILQHNHLTDADSSSSEVQLLIYRNYKTLNAIQLEPAGTAYNFQVRTGDTPQNRFMVQGTISPAGVVTNTQKQAVFGDCPRCLALGAQIDTPIGPVAVQDLRAGMVVWTTDAAGERRAVPLVAVAQRPVPIGSMLIRVVLADGRSLLASPAHPMGDRHVLGAFELGDWLDGSQVVRLEPTRYDEMVTYDILPSGGTGQYWANGILVGSTLRVNPILRKNIMP